MKKIILTCLTALFVSASLLAQKTKPAPSTKAVVEKYKIGQFAHGSVVFYVDSTGQHGLVCAKKEYDASDLINWDLGTYLSTEATQKAIMTGAENTAKILKIQGLNSKDTYTAKYCSELVMTESGKTYEDWVLPSIDELMLIYKHRSIINASSLANKGTALGETTAYWSSTEFSKDNAYYVYFAYGEVNNNKKDHAMGARAVQVF